MRLFLCFVTLTLWASLPTALCSGWQLDSSEANAIKAGGTPYFTTKIENLTVEMTYTSKEFVDFLIKSVGSEFGRSVFTKEFQAQKAAQTGHINQ